MGEEEELLKNLEDGEYDGFRVDFPSYGSVKRGRSIDKGVYIMDGQIVEFTEKTTKLFDGKESERKTSRETYIPETDDEKLALLQKVGYKMYDHVEVRNYSKSFYEERAKVIKEAQDTKATLAESAISEMNDDYGQDSYEVSDSDDSNRKITISKNNSDSDNGAVVIIVVAVAVFLGTWVAIKNAPKVKKWWKQKIIPKFNKESKMAQFDAIPCPACGDKLKKNTNKVWKCKGCEYSISDEKLISTVFWFCDECGEFLNIQPRFSSRKSEFTCTECGCKNSIIASNILDE